LYLASYVVITKDGRVVFLLPWQGRVIAGTTDTLTKVTHFPHPHENEINFILEVCLLCYRCNNNSNVSDL
jgi:glycerol-3-phosphate dehydrogenase